MRHAGTGVYGARSRALIVVLWRAGLRISEALALAESDLDPTRGSILVRRGKGGRRREIGMDPWGWEQLRPWRDARIELPVGALVLRDRRTEPRAPMGTRRRAQPPAAASRARRGTPPLCATSAPSRPRRRDGPRRHPAQRDPTSARTFQPRHHQRLSARYRQPRDHRHRLRPTSTHAPRQFRPVPVALFARSSTPPVDQLRYRVQAKRQRAPPLTREPRPAVAAGRRRLARGSGVPVRRGCRINRRRLERVRFAATDLSRSGSRTP